MQYISSKGKKFNFIKQTIFHEPSYLKDREFIWKDTERYAKKENIPLWNGIVYATTNYEQKDSLIHINLSTIEYKDLVYRRSKGKNFILKHYPQESYPLYFNVQIIIKDKEENYLLGLTGQKTIEEKGLITFVGGTVRKSKNYILQEINDLDKYALDEIEEETHIEINPKRLIRKGLVCGKETITFIYEYEHEGPLSVELLKIGEFSRGTILRKSELIANTTTLNPRALDIINCIKNNYV